MALIEKQLAEAIVSWRQQEATGTGYVPIADAITIAIDSLSALQAARQQLTEQVEQVEQ